MLAQDSHHCRMLSVARLSPEAVQQLATHAENANPSVIDSISNFYAQHTTVVKTLGVRR
jgi:hypothetical protein